MVGYVNSILERDLSVRLEIIDDNDALVYATYPDPQHPIYSGGATEMCAKNQEHIKTIINNSEFDIGHVFGCMPAPPDGTLGIGEFSSACNNEKKALVFSK